jgi:hypothetical protein
VDRVSTELLTGGEGVATAERLPRVGPWLRRNRLWLLLAAALVVAALVADQWQQQRELDRMTTAMQSGEQQISATDGYFDGVLAYYSPVIFRESPPAGLRDGFQTDVGQGAQDGVDGIGATTRELDGITILPWHRHLRAARTAYEVRISLWREFLTRTTTDASALFDPVPGFSESATATTAALRLALPLISDATDRLSVEGVLPKTP